MEEPKRRRAAGAMRAGRPARALERTDPIFFPVVGLGASAGGLDAFKRLLEALPAKSGMAFILIQHLAPSHESLMVELLAGHTSMKIIQATEAMPIGADQVYVIPPGAYLAIRDGALHLSKPSDRHGTRMPFDFFLRSLAAECGERAVCAILSGTGADGTLGLKSIKERGGLVIAQDPDEAAFDGMPRSAIRTGAVDLVLPAAAIAETLANYGKQRHLGRDAAAPRATQDRLAEIIDLLRTKTSHTFTLYKEATLLRRIERRMAIAAIEDADRYLEVLRRDSEELELLAKDLLISVTSFFRDAAAFELLAENFIPELVRKHGCDRPLRIWIAGSSTGEETYSLAMLFLEAIAALPNGKSDIKLQVFASDVDEDAVTFARNGLYPETIVADVSPARLARFFTKEDDGYRVARQLREAVVFTVQDLLTDAPFSRLDLVSCRNLLIYLRPEVQTKVLSLFHFALADGGILFLGTSETVGELGHRFEPLSKKQRIFRRIGRTRPGEVEFPIGDGGRAPRPRLQRHAAPHRVSLGDLSQKLLLETYAPASVLINQKYEGLYYFGPTDRYLRVAAGEPSRNLLAMAREGLSAKLRVAIQQANGRHAPTTVSGAVVQRDGAAAAVTIRVQPMQSDGEELLLVSFLDEPKSERKSALAAEAADISRLAQLEQELETTRKELQAAIHDLELTNEELKSLNEEAMSVNEEFQSTNEELETSKEELQSLNEELTALNGQLQETLERQRATSTDLQNILISTDAPTLFLDRELNIRFFTPATKSLFSIVASDIGRPLADLTHRFTGTDLLVDARAVLASLTQLRREIEADNGAWYIQRILPYLTLDNRVEGVIFTFADISEMKAARRDVQAALAYSDSIIDTIPGPLVVLDEELRVVFASGAFYRAFAVVPDETVGRQLAAAGDRRLDVPALRGFLDLIRADGAAIEDYQIEIDLAGLGRRTLLLNARNIRDKLAKRAILVAIEDITDRKRIEEALEAAKLQAERANLGKSRFLAAASHDLRQPLQTFSLLQGILAKKVKDKDALDLIARLDETLSAMSGMLNTLLDINQLEAGIVRPEKVSFRIQDLLDKLRTEFAYHAQSQGLGWHVPFSSQSVWSDPGLLEQMIRNLLSNAVKYTRTGKILLGCRRRGDKLRIEVWDTGAGIPAEQLHAIFEEFHQLDNPARERSRGLGLGLSIVQRLGNLLDHPIDVRSRPGKGSVFAVEVPLAEGRARSYASPDVPGIEESADRTSSILIIDDDPEIREILDLLLKGEGHRTYAVGDGNEALTLVERGSIRPDLILADYNLPGGLNGLQVVTGLREMLSREVPVIILTGDISTDTLRDIARERCVQRNKPIRADELTRLIQSLLAIPPPAASPVRTRQPSKSDDGRQPPTVFVIDDDPAICDAMRGLLQEERRPVEVFASCEAFLEAYHPGREGCLVVDAHMPGMGGIALLERLKAEGNAPPAIMITGHGDVPMAVRAMRAGAVGFIQKPISPDEFLTSIARALALTRDTVALLAWRETAAARIAGLTVRERQVMDLVVTGNPNKEIAALLTISQRTVENHRASVMKKIGARSLSELIHMTLSSSPDKAWQSMY
jgi:two-component system, chemotaxis family, CheB/CheR fusion protein